MAGLNQTELGKVLGITKQSYSNKERGVNQFNDSEKTKFKEFINEFFPGISIDEIFFSQKVCKSILEMRCRDELPCIH